VKNDGQNSKNCKLLGAPHWVVLLLQTVVEWRSKFGGSIYMLDKTSYKVFCVQEVLSSRFKISFCFIFLIETKFEEASKFLQKVTHKLNKRNTYYNCKVKFPLAPMQGPCYRVCACLTLRSAPIDTSGNLSRHVRVGSFQAILSTSRCLKKKKKKKKLGCPPNFFSPKISYFLWLKTPCKISEPYDNPFWEKSNPAEERQKERREIMALTVNT
jgi:hypothetical protein